MPPSCLPNSPACTQAQRFMAAMRDRLLAPATRHQWDQTAWNEVIIPHLWGSGDEPPLRYRLLPPRSFFGGVGNYESRLEAGLPVDPVILHSGGLHGGAKQATYERLGLFHADFSLPARPRPGAVGTHGLPEHRQQQWQNATAAAAAAAAGQAAQEAKVAASAGLGFRGLVAPSTTRLCWRWPGCWPCWVLQAAQRAWCFGGVPGRSRPGAR
jgi:hypothetical protein